MTLSYVQALSLYQAGSGNIIGATSIVLTNLTDIYGNVLTMTDFGAKGYGTCEPDTNGEESFTFTGITPNANGTYTLTGVSTALAVTPYTETSGLIRQHAGGTKVVISDTTAFWNTFGNTANPNTWAALQTFSVLPTIPVTPVASTDAASKGYVDGVAVSGAPNASTTVKGIVQEATQVQMDAGTASGSTGADLYPTPALLRSKLLSDYVADTGAADVYVITPSPAIAAYATGQRFSFKLSATNATTTPTLNVNGKGAKTIVKVGGTAMAAGDLLIGQVVEVEYDGTNMQLMSPVATAPLTVAAFNAAVKFGGTGADGALTVTSGNTNIDCANAAIIVKNYTSISITGTGSVTFINPATNGTLIIIKSQGAVTLTSSATPMLSAASMGAAGGASVTASNASGLVGNNGTAVLISTNPGVAPATGANGAGGAVPTAISVPTSYVQTLLKYPLAFVGAGGSSGGTANGGTSVTTGAGGIGGGGLIIECGGALNFTTTSGISVAAGNGGNAVEGSTSVGGGGGGGAGGFCLIQYNTLTSASGTITVTGGTGGNSGASGSGQTRGGGGGGGSINAGTMGTTTASASTKCGGNGAAGYSLITANTNFV